MRLIAAASSRPRGVEAYGLVPGSPEERIMKPVMRGYFG